MRITQSMMVGNQLSRLQTRLQGFERAQSQLGTGKSILRPSDDPAGSNRGLVLRAQLRAREQHARAAEDATAWLNLADSKIGGTVDRLHRARDLVVAGASNQNDTSRRAMAAEITTIRDELVGIANSRHAGRPLFTGFLDGQAVTGGAGTWAYDGDDGQIMRRVGEHDTVRVNVTAGEVFGFDDGDDVFSLLDRVESALLAGDEATLGGQLGDLDVALDRLSDHRAIVGAATNRVESSLERIRDDQLTIRGELAATEDVDVAEAVMELQTQEVAYQATLSALDRVLQPSLVDFLR